MSKLSLYLPLFRGMISPGTQPYFCTFIVTWRCNARCVMCDIWQKAGQAEMDSAQIRDVLKKISDIRVIRLTGGEPFLREDLGGIVSDVFRYTKAQIVHITTNGILTDRIKTFAEDNASRRLHIKISLNAVGERHDRVMGVPGAFDRVMDTIRELKKRCENSSLFLGINQTITDWPSYEDSKEIRKLCRSEGLAYLPVLAYQPVALYSLGEGEKNESPRFVPFGEFSHDQLREMLRDFLEETARIKNLTERIVKRYYLNGLSARLLEGKDRPRPPCVALRNHIRLLPNGDIPVCLYNAKIMGNLQRQDLNEVWEGQNVRKMRGWVKACSGCWAECEVIPSAVFSSESLVPFLTSI